MKTLNMKKSIFIIILLTSLNLFSQNKDKQENKIDSLLTKCLEINTTTADMRNCIMQAEKSWDKELNKYYQLLLKKLPTSGKEKLKKAQIAWIKYRDDELLFESNYYFEVKQGTMFHVMANNSRMEFIKNRALELEKYYDMLDY